MKHEKIRLAIDYAADWFKVNDEEARDAAASVWFDRIIGLMGNAPAEYSRFGWFMDERKAIENILYCGLLLAKGATPSRSPARILYRLTRADSATAVTAHSIAICQGQAGRVVLEWSAQIKEMGT